MLTNYYEVAESNDYVQAKSVTVTWPCLFHLTPQSAQDANVTKGSIAHINRYEMLAIVNVT